MNLRDRRIQYETAGLAVEDLDESPIQQWHAWYIDAVKAELPEPNAVVIGTVDETGMPDARIVLARAVDDEGITFYGNYDSAKGRQLETTPLASAVFAWVGLHRQVRVRGYIEVLPAADSDSYFASRPRDSQIGAWTSPQSEVIEDRAILDHRYREFSDKFAGTDVLRPPHWGGWLLVPDVFEFWQGRPNRLHDRLRYRRDDSSEGWIIERLAP